MISIKAEPIKLIRMEQKELSIIAILDKMYEHSEEMLKLGETKT